MLPEDHAMTTAPRRLALGLMPLVLCLLPACQQKMAVQPSYRPDEASVFFDDGRANRPLPDGTVARGQLRTDLALFTGRTSRSEREWALVPALLGTLGRDPFGAAALAVAGQGDHVDSFPFPVTREVLEHGRNRFVIYCAVCHDALGTGRGKIVERGYTPPPTYHQPRLRDAPPGYLFAVITHGYGSMPAYAQQIPPRDRWAIVSHIRALQLSQHFPESRLTDAMRQEWKDQDEAAGTAQSGEVRP